MIIFLNPKNNNNDKNKRHNKQLEAYRININKEASLNNYSEMKVIYNKQVDRD